MSLNNARIMVVEDEFMLARELTFALEQAGATVIGPVPTVQRAIARLKEEAVDAAVLDIHVRGDAVFPVADALKERAVPFVFATGYDQHPAGNRFGGAQCLLKPIDFQRLVRVLEEMLVKA